MNSPLKNRTPAVCGHTVSRCGNSTFQTFQITAPVLYALQHTCRNVSHHAAFAKHFWSQSAHISEALLLFTTEKWSVIITSWPAKLQSNTGKIILRDFVLSWVFCWLLWLFSYVTWNFGNICLCVPSSLIAVVEFYAIWHYTTWSGFIFAGQSVPTREIWNMQRIQVQVSSHTTVSIL